MVGGGSTKSVSILTFVRAENRGFPVSIIEPFCNLYFRIFRNLRWDELVEFADSKVNAASVNHSGGTVSFYVM